MNGIEVGIDRTGVRQNIARYCGVKYRTIVDLIAKEHRDAMVIGLANRIVGDRDVHIASTVTICQDPAAFTGSGVGYSCHADRVVADSAIQSSSCCAYGC